MSLKLLFLIFMIFCPLLGISQDRQEIAYKNYFEFDQEFGLHKERSDFILIVERAHDSIKWKDDKQFGFSSGVILTETKNYLTAQMEDGTNLFYLKADHQIYYLKKWETTYTAYGFGKGSLSLQESVTQMIRLIKSGKTEAEVIDFLSKQAEYDF